MRVEKRLLVGLACTGLCAGALFFGAVSFNAGAAPGNVTINIDNFAFTPAETMVAAGTTVVWTNRDDIPHLVAAADTAHLFRSAALDTDDHFAFKFDHAGRFAYFCALHPQMQGVVVVK